jgi:hypothetical protein
MEKNNLHIYDKAKYHAEEVEQNGLPDHQAYNHTTFFFSWLVNNNLTSEWLELECKSAQYREGEISINQLYEWFDTCLASDMLSDRGNAFAMAYFNFSNGSYLSDYHDYLQNDLPSEFHVPYTQENENIIHAVISQRYDVWSQLQLA